MQWANMWKKMILTTEEQMLQLFFFNKENLKFFMFLANLKFSLIPKYSKC